jgi:hypothetical protein
MCGLARATREGSGPCQRINRDCIVSTKFRKYFQLIDLVVPASELEVLDLLSILSQTAGHGTCRHCDKIL